MPKKNKNAILLVCYFRSLVFDQSSPVYLDSESRGGWSEADGKQKDKGGRKYLYLVVDVLKLYYNTRTRSNLCVKKPMAILSVPA